MVKIDVAQSLLSQSPLIFAWIVGVVIAVKRWKKHPKISQLVLFSLILQLLLFGSGFLYSVYGGTWARPNLSLDQYMYELRIIGIVSNIISAFSWLLIISAVFRSRNQLSSDRPVESITNSG